MSTPNQTPSLTIDEVKTRHRRLAILRALAGTTSGSANLFVFRNWLPELGLAVATDELRADIRMLASAGLVVLKDEHDAWPFTLTQRGEEVAQGLITVDGVEKPSPDCPY